MDRRGSDILAVVAARLVSLPSQTFVQPLREEVIDRRCKHQSFCPGLYGKLAGSLQESYVDAALFASGVTNRPFRIHCRRAETDEKDG